MTARSEAMVAVDATVAAARAEIDLLRARVAVLEAAARKFLADVEAIFPIHDGKRDWHPDSLDALRAALALAVPKGER